MNDPTSRRTWLQTLFATLAGLVALRISPTAAAPIVSRPPTKPTRDIAELDTVSYSYDCDPPGNVTKYTYDSQGRLTSVTEGPGTATYFNYE